MGKVQNILISESCRASLSMELKITVLAIKFHSNSMVALWCLKCSSCVIDVLHCFLLLLCQGEEESFILKSCTRRKTDSIEKRFCFDVEAVDRLVNIHPAFFSPGFTLCVIDMKDLVKCGSVPAHNLRISMGFFPLFFLLFFLKQDVITANRHMRALHSWCELEDWGSFSCLTQPSVAFPFLYRLHCSCPLTHNFSYPLSHPAYLLTIHL